MVLRLCPVLGQFCYCFVVVKILRLCPVLGQFCYCLVIVIVLRLCPVLGQFCYCFVIVMVSRLCPVLGEYYINQHKKFNKCHLMRFAVFMLNFYVYVIFSVYGVTWAFLGMGQDKEISQSDQGIFRFL